MWQDEAAAGHTVAVIRNQREMNRKWDSAISPQGPPPSDLLPPVRLHLLKVLKPSQTVPSGVQVFSTSVCGEHHIQTTTWSA